MAQFEMKAEISGTVLRFDVGVGDQVELDDQVMTLESMKMEIPMLTPRAGKLTSFAVAVGQSVQEGQTLATLDIE